MNKASTEVIGLWEIANGLLLLVLSRRSRVWPGGLVFALANVWLGSLILIIFVWPNPVVLSPFFLTPFLLLGCALTYVGLWDILKKIGSSQQFIH